MSYRALLARLDAWFARGAAAAGPGVVPCCRGCSACCHGPFDISPADAALVAEGVAVLPEGERVALQARAAEQLQLMAERVPGWGAPWDVGALPEPVFDALTEHFAQQPCPALGPAGACRIYAHRPATCRMLGLALATREGEVLENCCPIQAGFPAYAALAPVPFDLQDFESEAERYDRLAAELGGVSTTVAGAIAATSRRPG
jgi:Fe-S-cluster containining protein